MSKNKLKTEPIEFFLPDGGLSVKPKNGKYWTKKSVLHHLAIAGIKFPLYECEPFRKDGKRYMRLSQGSVSAIMLYKFWEKYVSSSEIMTLENIKVMADNGLVLYNAYLLSRLLIEGLYHDEVQFYDNEVDEVFTAQLTEDGSIIITNADGKKGEITIDDIWENVCWEGNNNFIEFSLVDEVEAEINYQCRFGFEE